MPPRKQVNRVHFFGGTPIFVAAGGFVGRFDRAAPSFLGYRDHHDSPPWTVTELHAMIVP
jgi:hypothetical protein